MTTFHQFLEAETPPPSSSKPSGGPKGPGGPPVPSGPPGGPPGLGGPIGGMGGPPIGGPGIGSPSMGGPGPMPGGEGQPAQPPIKMQRIKPMDVWDALEKSISKNKSGREGKDQIESPSR